MTPAIRDSDMPPTAKRFAIDLFEWPATTMAVWRTVPMTVATMRARMDMGDLASGL